MDKTIYEQNYIKLRNKTRLMSSTTFVPFILGKCKTRAAYSAKPQKPIKLNLHLIRQKYHVLIDTPILLVITAENIEIIVHGYGELIFKNSDDVNTMEKITKEIYSYREG